jgi:predicted negative regulator of RcsB-dependent stress response
MNEQRNNPGQPGMPGMPGFIDRIEAEATDTMHPILKWILDNVKLLGVAAAVILVIVAGYSAFAHYQENARIEDQNRLGQILAQGQGEGLIKDLQAYIATGPHSANKAMLELARAQMASGDYAGATATWERLSSTKIADLRTVALMGKAHTLSLDGKQDQALATLTSHRSSAPQPFHNSIDLQISEVAENSGDLKAALAAYESLRKNAKEEADMAFYDFKINKLKDQIG